MGKYNMLKFNEPTQIGIESCASVFLLFCAGYMIYGVFEGKQTQTGMYMLIFFAVVFAVGGVIGLVKTYIRHREYQKRHPRRKRPKKKM